MKPVESARAAAKPATPSRQTAASAPPAIFPFDQAGGVADGVRPARAGGDHRVVRSLEAVADRDLAGGQVDQGGGDEEGADPARPSVMQRDRGIRDPLQAADAGADHDPGALPGVFVLGHPAGVLDRLLGGRDPIEDEVIDLAPVLRRHEMVGVEIALFDRTGRHLAGDPGRQVGHVEALDTLYPRLPRRQPFPDMGYPDAQGGHEADTGDDDSSHALLLV